MRRAWGRSAEALHAAAFLVDPDDEGGRANGVERVYQGRELLRIEVVACEQDHTAHEWMPQELELLRSDLRAGEVDHQGTETHTGAAVALRLPPAVSNASDST
jgi:hypothetical protein